MRRKRKLKKKAFFTAIVLLFLIIGCIAFFIYNIGDKPKKEETTDEKITITFDTDGGSSVDNETIKKGGKIILPETIKDGFTFLGWYNEEEEVTNLTRYDKDTTLKAKWEESKNYIVTFDSKGGSNVDSMTIACGMKIGLPEEPTKKGYTFSGWIDKSEKEIIDGEVLPCEDITLTAKWDKEQTNSYYTITFDSKGGSKVDSIKEECGKAINFPVNPTRDGYTFVAWKDKNGKEVLYESFQACESMTLYAEWQVKNSGTPQPTPIPTTEPTPVVTPTPEAKETTCPEGQELKDGKCVEKSVNTDN